MKHQILLGVILFSFFFSLGVISAFNFEGEDFGFYKEETTTTTTINNGTIINVSNYWDNLDTINTTQMEDNGGVLNILESWLDSLYCQLTGCTMSGDLDLGGNNIVNLGDVDFKTGAVGGTLRTGTSAADSFELQAYDVNDGTYRNVFRVEAGNDVVAFLKEIRNISFDNGAFIDDLQTNELIIHSRIVNFTNNVSVKDELFINGEAVSIWLYNETIATFNLYNSTWDNKGLINSLNLTTTNNFTNVYSLIEGLNSTTISNLTTLYGLVGTNHTSVVFELYNSTWDNKGLITSLNTSTTSNLTNVYGLIEGVNSTTISNLSNVYGLIGSVNDTVVANLTTVYSLISSNNESMHNFVLAVNESASAYTDYVNTTAGAYTLYVNTTSASYTDYVNTTAGAYADLHQQSSWVGTADPFIYNTTAKVGIGTSSPGKLLEIAEGSTVGSGNLDTGPVLRINNNQQASTWGDGGDEQWGAIEFYTDDDSAGGNAVKGKIAINSNANYVNPEGELVFYTSTAAGSLAEQMRIDSTGQVGIGTSSPNSKLEVATADSNTEGIRISNTGGEYVDFYYGGSLATNTFAISRTGTGGADIVIKDDGDIGLATAGDKVGIGTDSPDAELHVKDGSGATNVLIESTVTDVGLVIKRSSTNIWALGVDNTGGGLHLSHSDTLGTNDIIVIDKDSHAINFNNTLYTDGAGKVGIGTSSPTYEFQIDGRLGFYDSVASGDGAYFIPDGPATDNGLRYEGGLFQVNSGGFQANDYYSGDGTKGGTGSVSFVDAIGDTHVVTLKDGLTTSWTVDSGGGAVEQLS